MSSAAISFEPWLKQYSPAVTALDTVEQIVFVSERDRRRRELVEYLKDPQWSEYRSSELLSFWQRLETLHPQIAVPVAGFGVDRSGMFVWRAPNYLEVEFEEGHKITFFSDDEFLEFDDLDEVFAAESALELLRALTRD